MHPVWLQTTHRETFSQGLPTSEPALTLQTLVGAGPILTDLLRQILSGRHPWLRLHIRPSRPQDRHVQPFPGMFEGPLTESIIKRAVAAGLVQSGSTTSGTGRPTGTTPRTTRPTAGAPGW